MGDQLAGFAPKGPLLECFENFPQFFDDLVVLINEGYIKVNSGIFPMDELISVTAKPKIT